METVTLTKKRAFADALNKVPLFESERLTFDLYCLQPGQSQRVHVHGDADKVYVVLEGEALFDVGGDQELLPEGTAVIARAGEPHGVSNESTSNLVLLVSMAPRPS
ncbi:MAG TPA: cupin domain-containing protein [Trueperaceae bacterium]|nr:cupin domain-containing protein [Trueperaceae bacterium]